MGASTRGPSIHSDTSTASATSSSSSAKVVHGGGEGDAHTVVDHASTTPDPRDEYYKTYDVMTGVRIAATLGGIILFCGVFILYKAKCKGHSNYDKTESKDDVVESTGIEYKVDDEEGVCRHVGDPTYSERFRSYSHFQARMSTASGELEGAVGYDPDIILTPPQTGEDANDNHSSPLSGDTLLARAGPSTSYGTSWTSDVQVHMRTPMPFDSPLEGCSTWGLEEQGACGGGEPLCFLVPNLRTADDSDSSSNISETKC